ncbi:acyl-CoA dehydrogenase family protein [Saccharopolyspora gregorii]|uniref:Acyl-CoA oxidase/dehydrogenase middle domain-containing protein n=1 Tax=Saccharopolyspora gregorii TaxID=33914 RepID=A0ABP6S350_9PSEU
MVNGQKTWCSNAHLADHVLLIARTGSGGTKHEGLTQFVVPTGTPGLQIQGIDTMGGREVNDLYFTDCFLHDDRGRHRGPGLEAADGRAEPGADDPRR